MSARLAEMLSTRLCHDLTGPIGAVSNGAEFLEDEESGMQDQAMELIVSSAQEAVNRMQFYRRAYGRVNSNGEADLEEQRALIEKYLESLPVTLNWPIESMDVGKVSLSKKMSRVLLNLVIIGVGSLLKGGSLTIELFGDDGTDKQVRVLAEGQSIKLDEAVAEALLGNVRDSDLTPKNVQAFFLHQVIEEIESDITFDVTDAALSLTVSKAISN